MPDLGYLNAGTRYPLRADSQPPTEAGNSEARIRQGEQGHHPPGLDSV
jgi:hypothetical protein